MGWNGMLFDKAPSIAERKQIMIDELTFCNPERSDCKVIKATMRGNVGFALQEIWDIRSDEVKVVPVAMLTSYEKGELFTKFVNPIVMYTEFPITWIDKITVKDLEHAEMIKEWKGNIRAAKEAKKAA